MPRRSAVAIAIAIGILIAVAGAGGIWYLFFREAGPAAVSLPSTSPGSTSSLAGGLGGSWTVDASASFVGYRVQEQLVGIGANTAVGRTSSITGTLTASGTTISAVEMSADLTTLKSDSDQRDGRLRDDGLQTSRFPTATFKLTAPIELGAVPSEGQTVTATATGDLTIHGTTKSVQIPLKAQLQGGKVTVVGSIEIVFADYGFSGPSSFKVLSVEDHGIMEFQLVFGHG
ncbi:MAG TPA: YceI family protein [Candidatus Limnocylindrales bacterium]|nr:YceI family protein [Candidatus Limnocylindrales bacterium]